ncbi:hypothetical protein [Stenomitos frigidus]|uniref:Uncharacterized protein n=1 Tax=Stenomitos frigidus ULC18 TaxID=2107698 RepID=A0A2T1EAW5_9CYAN|nr:hypothetical protein [Stenomitos frigidus]PSB29899.1 hypothetical protein C7B82_10120 [Stenomitos frigidus ULC18]
MKFTEAPANDHYVVRYLSDTGVWECGIVPVIFGFRICANAVRDDGYSLVYCCGSDRGMLLAVLALVMAGLEQFDEQVAPWQVESAFPVQTIKPMIKDVACWEALGALANWDRVPV